ncbi:hypothetical protein [Amycolatopsis sp.]|jgi:hypothetical protein|uniref:hypothetical protein n=1 Tax=Amycolatopsis sp. TaxID=37632 RepID=UPI002DFCF46C|nr:hypothetical protein [Amycolatopsis sp.]
MRRIAAGLVLVLATCLGVVFGPVGSASAEPTTHLGPLYTTGGRTEMTFIWYNRSVGVQGYVENFGLNTTTVTFKFFQESTLLATQTRSASAQTKSFNFTQAGPSGGITEVDVKVCTGTACSDDYVIRPF